MVIFNSYVNLQESISNYLLIMVDNLLAMVMA